MQTVIMPEVAVKDQYKEKKEVTIDLDKIPGGKKLCYTGISLPLVAIADFAELGKTDCGGGGTVAKYIANHNIETIDLGVPVISMHAPYEAIAKVDLYETHRAFSAFCKY